MSKPNLPQKPYTIRVEGRDEHGWREMWRIDFATRERAIRDFAWTADNARYWPYGDRRMTLLGPDRTVLPEPFGERPAKPGEVCTCGRPAVTVYTGGKWGDTGYCGLPDGGRPGPCPFCGGKRHQGRCQQYRVMPAVDVCKNCGGSGMDSTRHLDVLEDHPCGYCGGSGEARPGESHG